MEIPEEVMMFGNDNNVAGAVFAAVVASMVALILGLVLGSSGSSGGNISDTGMRWIGEAIGGGIAHAACIEQRGRWSYNERCEFEK